MNCTRYTLYLSAAPDELDRATASAVEAHLETCAACRAEAGRFAAIRATLAVVAEPEPGPELVPSILASTLERRRPGAAAALVPIPPVELARVLQDNREAIIGAGAAAIVAAGATWAIWKGLRSLTKPSPQRA